MMMTLRRATSGTPAAASSIRRAGFSQSAACLSLEPGTAGDCDFDSLGFGYTPSRCFVEYEWTAERGGCWDGGVLRDGRDPTVSLHVMSSTMHYGQGIFEGCKAHHGANGDVALWNVRANAARLNAGAARMAMPPVPESLFVEACKRAVANNVEYVPAYQPDGQQGSLYLRPLLFGKGPQLGLQPAEAYGLLVLAIPVASYYKGAELTALDALVLDGFDRAAPCGVGATKCAGNYGSDIVPSSVAKRLGFASTLYLDAAERRFIEEFSVANFIGISSKDKDKDKGKDKDMDEEDDWSNRSRSRNKQSPPPPTTTSATTVGGGADGDLSDFVYTTPDSPSVLPSLTNQMLQALAARRGMRVDKRPVALEECGTTFQEAAACGTAVVLAPCRRIVRRSALPAAIAPVTRDHVVANAATTATCGAATEQLPPELLAGPPTEEYAFQGFSVLQKLYDEFRGIQTGDCVDHFGWNEPVDVLAYRERLPQPEEKLLQQHRVSNNSSTDTSRRSGREEKEEKDLGQMYVSAKLEDVLPVVPWRQGKTKKMKKMATTTKQSSAGDDRNDINNNSRTSRTSRTSSAELSRKIRRQASRNTQMALLREKGGLFEFFAPVQASQAASISSSSGNSSTSSGSKAK
eukprot:g4022.t1